METLSIEYIINKVFGKYPRQPNTFNIIYPDCNEQLDIVILTHFMLAGCKKIFGNITPATMTEKQFNLLQDYMKSMGYVIKYSFETEKVKIWFEKYTVKTRCNGMIIP